MGDGGGEVLSYHRLSMHRPERYAPGPGGLDWATQPAPFRQYRGCRQIELLHRPLEESPPYDGVFSGPAAAPSRLDRRSLSQMLYDGLALSAWKEAGGTRWALRVNPSSGNLHPTEAYLLLPGATLEPAPLLAHYRPDKHALEVRGELPATLASLLDDCLPPGGCLLALTSVHWREAWKYGERAYRYCQHDLGHALACLSIAAAIQGWEMRLLRGVAESALDGLFGLDRDGFAECESVDALFWIGPALTQEPSLSPRLCEGLAALPLAGAPNRLSREYRDWPE
ncbi:SagB/ThcOx family dehydrogenase, partial [Pseudomonas aeruginosa]|nr:SagB/ThcOx family dehydrogenase [Pseudomonas aeruginosa]